MGSDWLIAARHPEVSGKRKLPLTKLHQVKERQGQNIEGCRKMPKLVVPAMTLNHIKFAAIFLYILYISQSIDMLKLTYKTNSNNKLTVSLDHNDKHRKILIVG